MCAQRKLCSICAFAHLIRIVVGHFVGNQEYKVSSGGHQRLSKSKTWLGALCNLIGNAVSRTKWFSNTIKSLNIRTQYLPFVLKHLTAWCCSKKRLLHRSDQVVPFKTWVCTVCSCRRYATELWNQLYIEAMEWSNTLHHWFMQSAVL